MSYLTEKDIDRSWSYGADVREMRREFRKLLDANPEAFATCVREYMQFGEKGFPNLEATGGRYPTPKHALAALLAEYLVAQSKGITQEQFIESEAEQGVWAASKYCEVNWQSESAIRESLKKARKLARTDEEFAERVEFYEFGCRILGGFRKG